MASDLTAWRLLALLDGPTLAELRAVRAQARQVAWAQHAENCGDQSAPTRPYPSWSAKWTPSIVPCHAERDRRPRPGRPSASTPLFCFLDNTGEAASVLLREGRVELDLRAQHFGIRLYSAPGTVPRLAGHCGHRDERRHQHGF